MPSETLDSSSFSPDILEFIRLLDDHQVRFLIVGGEAVIFYGHIRVTGDVDFFFDHSAENVERLFDTLLEFWQGEIPSLKDAAGLQKRGVIFQFGIPPNRIDLLNQIDGVEFEDAWATRNTVMLEIHARNIQTHYIGLEELIQNKEASARPKDLDDLPFLVHALEIKRNGS